jgi:hypothetical protein
LYITDIDSRSCLDPSVLTSSDKLNASSCAVMLWAVTADSIDASIRRAGIAASPQRTSQFTTQ